MTHKTFGERLRYARTQAGLSQVDLADKLSISATAVRTYEADRGKPQVYRVPQIAKALNVSEAWLMTGEETFEEAEPQFMEAENEVEFLIDELRTAIAKRMKIPAEWVVVQPQLHYPKFESPVGRDFPV
jgi:transcriptional regulator with XRE-family HTH domain